MGNSLVSCFLTHSVVCMSCDTDAMGCWKHGPSSSVCVRALFAQCMHSATGLASTSRLLKFHSVINTMLLQCAW